MKKQFTILLVLILFLLTGCSLKNIINQKSDDNFIKITGNNKENQIKEDEIFSSIENLIPDITKNENSNSFYRIFHINTLLPSSEIYELKINIPVDKYNYYKNNYLGHKFDKSKNIALWATPDESILKNIAEELRDLEIENKNFYFINSIFEIARNIKYVSDYSKDESGEYWNFPIETLFEGKGDCEDISFLVAGLFSAIGWDVVLTGLPGHMAMAIEMPDVAMKSLYNTDHIPFDYYLYNNKKYYYVETTNLNDFKFSEIPQEYKNIIPEFFSVLNKASISEELTIPISATSKWEIFTFIDDNFKILFPSDPQFKTNYYRTAKYNTYEICVDFICYLVVASGGKGDSEFASTLEQESEIALIDQPKSELISIKETTFNGYPSYDLLIKNDKNIYIKVKKVYANDIFYQIRASYEDNKCEENNCDQFFNSFQLIK